MKHRRRRYIVNSGFQGRFVLGFVLATLVGSTASTVLFNFLALKRLEQLQWSVFVTVRSAAEAVEPLFVSIVLFNLLFVSVLLAVAWGWMMRKINGPLNGIVKNLKRVREGDFSSAIFLRRNDEFQDVAAALNEMLGKTRERFRDFTAGYEQISQALADLEIALAGGAPVKEKNERLVDMIGKLRGEITAEKTVSSERV